MWKFRRAKARAPHRSFLSTLLGSIRPGSQLDRRMMQEVYEALESRDIVILLLDAARGTATRPYQEAIASGGARKQ